MTRPELQNVPEQPTPTPNGLVHRAGTGAPPDPDASLRLRPTIRFRPNFRFQPSFRFRPNIRLQPSLRFRVRVWLADQLTAFIDEWQAGAKAYWVPIAFALGIVSYFALPREPVFGALLALCLLLMGCLTRLPDRPLMRTGVSALFLLAAGMTSAQFQVKRVDTPVLSMPVTAAVEGRVERADVRPNNRLRLRVLIAAFDTNNPLVSSPRRIEISARRPIDPATNAPLIPPIGASVQFKARLFPPQGPVLPGGYDFARARLLRGVGASGFVYGHVHMSPAAPSTDHIDKIDQADQKDRTDQKDQMDQKDPGAWRAPLSVKGLIADIRRAIAERLQHILPEREAAIAIALTVGERSFLKEETQEALRASGLAHILAISGLHMMLVSGTVFYASRFLLVLIPDLALNWPLKKVAAVIALVVASAYLTISGAGVATQRAFIMASIAFISILLNKPAITMHGVAVAALLVMLLDPAAVTGAGFQMSFCAVVALIAAYRRHGPERDQRRRNKKNLQQHSAARLLCGHIVRGLSALALSSLIAGSATAPIAAYHFHRIAPFGLIANLLAMPMLSLWVMPLLLFTVLVMVLGLDPLLAPLIQPGLSWLVTVATWVTSWSGQGSIGLQSSALVIGALMGLFLLCLTRTKLRYLGLIPIGVGLALSPITSKPDLMISEDGRTAAVLEPLSADANEGESAAPKAAQLRFISARVPDFLASIWLRAHGDNKVTTDQLTSDKMRCDATTCWYRAFAIAIPSKQSGPPALSNLAPLSNSAPLPDLASKPDLAPAKGSKPNLDQNGGRLDSPSAPQNSSSQPGPSVPPSPSDPPSPKQQISSSTYSPQDHHRWQIPLSPDGLLIATVSKPPGLTAACRTADIVITDFRLKYPCRSAVLVADGRLLRQTGMISGTVKTIRSTTTSSDGSVQTAHLRTLHLKAAISPYPRPWTRWRHDARQVDPAPVANAPLASLPSSVRPAPLASLPLSFRPASSLRPAPSARLAPSGNPRSVAPLSPVASPDRPAPLASLASERPFLSTAGDL